MKLRLVCFLLLATVLARAEPEYPRMGPDIYDPKADGNALITAALGRAKSEHRNVLLMFGANWCIWCHRLHATLTTNPQVAAELGRNYELVMIDVNTRHGVNRNAQVDAHYGHPIRFGLPVLVVLDAEGKALATQDTGDLENGKDGHDPAKVMAFLQRWRPGA